MGLSRCHHLVSRLRKLHKGPATVVQGHKSLATDSEAALPTYDTLELIKQATDLQQEADKTSDWREGDLRRTRIDVSVSPPVIVGD